MDRVAAAEVVYIPAIVLGELEAGFRLGRRAEENRVTLSEFLAEPFVAVLPVSRRVARRYGQVFAQLRRAGTPIPVNDIWIAACTLERAAHLLTFDHDFERVENLDCTVLTP
jgi:tRNA(fMet)-specific endonuclease VapC